MEPDDDEESGKPRLCNVFKLIGIMTHGIGDVLCVKIRIFDYKQARYIPALKSKCIFCGRVCSAGKSSDNVMNLPK